MKKGGPFREAHTYVPTLSVTALMSVKNTKQPQMAPVTAPNSAHLHMEERRSMLSHKPLDMPAFGHSSRQREAHRVVHRMQCQTLPCGCAHVT